MTDELRDYFETAYICLGEYLEEEPVELATKYGESAEQLELRSEFHGFLTSV